nr:putative ribonuclease H-like domain-containing protein [Tanacetum cinerariifolium]
MKCKEDIQTYTKIRSEQKLFQFLNGLDRKFKPIKKEIIQVDPLPTAEAAYAMVCKEAAHQTILEVTNETHGIATGLIAKETNGMGLSTKGFRRFDGQKKPTTKDDKSHLKCEECGMNRHTKYQCFKIIGYPDWTGWIFRHGTERDGLYYVDEVVQSSTVMLAHGTTKREAWLWHRRLEHPSVSYLHTLFPDLFPLNKPMVRGEQGDPLSWLSYTSAATIGNEIQNHSTTSAEAPNISATPEHPVPDMIYEVSSSQPNNLDNPQPDNLDENNADDIQDSTSEILQEHEEEMPRKGRNKVPHLDNPQPDNLDNPQPDNLDNPQPDNLDENNADDIQDSTSDILQEHEEEVLRKYVLQSRSNRGVPPKRYSLEKTIRGAKYLMGNIAEGNLSNNTKAFAVSLCSKDIPSSFEQALKSEKYKKAMDDEMKALKKNKTWDQCALPQEKKPVGCRWIFTVKYKPDGRVERYKVQLVAKGHTQTYGIDYSETFSPMEKMDTIRVLLLVASNRGWPLYQFDVKNAFLHGELKEESPRAWFGRFTLAMKISEITKRDIHLSKNVVDLLAEIGMINCKLADTPMMVNQKLFMEKKANWLIETAINGGNLITWRSKKQKVVSLSSAEAEFRGIAKGLAEALWIRKLVSKIEFPPRGSTQIMCDNKDAIQISKNLVQHDRRKHVEVDRHVIKEKLVAGIIKLPFVKSSYQLADILTKAVGTDIFHKCLSKLNFDNPTIQLEGECWKRK